MSFLSRIRTRTTRLIIVAMVGLGIPVLSSVVATPAFAATQNLIYDCNDTSTVTIMASPGDILSFTPAAGCSGVTGSYMYMWDAIATSSLYTGTWPETLTVTSTPGAYLDSFEFIDIPFSDYDPGSLPVDKIKIYNVTVIGPPITASAVTPSTSTFGSPVTITGTNLDLATGVKVGYTDPATSVEYYAYVFKSDFISESSTAITLYLPSNGNFQTGASSPSTRIFGDGLTWSVLAFNMSSQSFATSMVINNTPLHLTLPAGVTSETGTVGTAFSYQLGATGGISPYTYGATHGTLPAGLTLNAATGLVSGTPTVAGTYSNLAFAVSDSQTATDSLGGITFVIQSAVIPPVVVISTPVPDPVQTGVVTSSSQSCAATGNSIVLTGSFAAPISLLTINGAAVSASSWMQTATTVTISYSATSDGSVAIQIYNGQSPVLNVVTFAYTATCPAPVLPVVPPVAPVVPPVVVPVVPPVDVPVVVPVVEPVVTPTPTPKPTTPTVSNPKIYFAVSFGFNSSKITSSQLALITKSAKLLKGTVKISGFRSQTQPGMDKTLATARANAVLAALKKLLPKGKFVITASYSAISNVCTKLVPKANNQCAVVFATS